MRSAMAEAVMMSREELKVMVDQLVEEKLNSLLGDPDTALELDAAFEARLRASLSGEGETRAAADVAEELGLIW
jgi:hypothetical protein